MNVGKNDRLIVIQAPTESKDAVGGVTITWATITRGSVWAEVRNLKGRELVDSQQRVSDIDTKFIIRYSSDVSVITAANRISFDSAIYDIKDAIALPGGRPTRIEILAKRKEAGNG